MSDSAPGFAARFPRRLDAAALAIVVVGVLAPVLDAPLFMDDYAHLLAIESPSLGLARLGANSYGVTGLDDREMRALSPWWTSPDFRFNYYRPASTLLIALDWKLWGRASRGYHLTSLLAHLAAVVLVHRLMVWVGIGRGAALTGAALFALHPGNLVPVYWVSNRSDLVALALSIAALFAYRRAARTSKRGWAWHGAAGAALVLAILTKEIACLVPCIFLLHDFTIGVKGDPGPRPGSSPQSTLHRSLSAAPYLTLGLAYVVWYRLSGHGIRSGYAPTSLGLGPLAHLTFVAKTAILAAAELITGLPPTIRRHEHLLDGRGRLLVLGAFLLAVVSATLLALRDRRRRAPRLFALGWIVLFTAPTLGFLPSSRYLYFASAGWAILVGSIVDGWLTAPSRAVRAVVLAASGAYVAIVPALADRWLMGRFRNELGRAFPALVESYSRTIGSPGEGDRILLVNTPSPATGSLIGAAFRFLHPGVDVHADALTTFATPPAVTAVDPHTLRVAAPPGHHFFEEPVDWIYLTSRRFTHGQRFRTAGFLATLSALDGDQPTEVTFRFDVPLADPTLVPICFDGPERVLRRCPFPAAEAGH